MRRYGRYRYETVRNETVVTGADGQATLTLADLDVGWYRISATAPDDAGREATATAYAWIYSTRRPWRWHGNLEISTTGRATRQATWRGC